MTYLYIAIGVIIAIGILIALFGEGLGTEEEKTKYQYKKKAFFMTRAEHEFYDNLNKAVGNEYLIFAQVHLPTLLDNKVVGQNWRGAFRHISEKSVDFVLCDKSYISPKIAIELDDKTHERPDRQERDIEVERIFKEAGLPLLRIENLHTFDIEELRHKIITSISNSK